MNKAIIRLAGAVVIIVLSQAATTLSEAWRVGISILVGLPSFVLMVISRSQLGSAFAVMPQAKMLVTRGLYSRIQHPMYFFLDLFLAAGIIVFNMAFLLWVWGLLVVIQLMQARREEKLLSVAFGEQYETYIRQTWF